MGPTMRIEYRAGLVRAAPLAAWGLLAAAAAWVMRFDPTDRIADPTGPCLWHTLFGIAGPSCGGTRMFFYLIHGDLVNASKMHLAALIGFGYGIYVLVVWTGGALLGRPVRVWLPGRPIIIAYVVFFLLYAVVLRNLPWPPFTWFAVPNLT
jgi:Protein of unknown function (DUF2752)